MRFTPLSWAWLSLCFALGAGVDAGVVAGVAVGVVVRRGGGK